MPNLLTALDHIQLAMPAGEEDAARHFYGTLLGLPEIPKPASLQKRGGVWFQGPGIAIHLGVEAGFHPAGKAHPCFRVSELEALRQSLEAEGLPIIPDENLPGVARFYTADPFDNRIEFQQDDSD
jgi:catechol 2,3-dioxygenase-like lactoylglutathione lyase family enzyme